jgi:exopolysaccharide biosynthesis polyprenyl glycosylphosphotransferase
MASLGPRQPFHWHRVVRHAVIRVTRTFDGACALCVMFVTFTTLNIAHTPHGIEEFLALRFSLKNVALVLIFIAVWHTCFALCGLYRTEFQSPITDTTFATARIVFACSLAAVLLSFFTFASSSGAFGFRVVLHFWIAGVAAELVGRAAIAAGGQYLERHAREQKLVVIVGSGPRALELYQAMAARQFRDGAVLGFLDSRDPEDIPPQIRSRMLGALDELESLLCGQPIGQVLIALPVKSCYESIQEAIDTCERVGVEAKYFPDIFSVALARHAFDHDDESLAVRLQPVADDHRIVVKRAIDIAGAVSGLIVLSPVFLLCAVVVKCTSEGPVFFSQLRYGHNRRQFRMYKFRTMVRDAEQRQAALEALNEAQGPVFKIRADPRVTRWGRVMRRLSLDELPQLFNVLKGEMSLVGPRPLPMRDVLKFDAAWLMRRFSVKPGLTCLWQVNGRSDTDFDRWVRLDLDYIDNWSLALDVRILLKTVRVVLSGAGAV